MSYTHTVQYIAEYTVHLASGPPMVGGELKVDRHPKTLSTPVLEFLRLRNSVGIKRGRA